MKRRNIDEVLEEIDRRKFLQLKQVLLPEVEIVEMIYVNPEDCNMVYNYSREPRPKLFRRLRQFRWIDPVHETVALNPVVFSSDIEIQHRPQTMHSSRDFQAMLRELKKSGTLSDRLYSMYAKELFISGTREDFHEAAPWFQARLERGVSSPDAGTETVCVLARHYELEQQKEAFLSLCLMEVATHPTPAAEICFLLGRYYEGAGCRSEALWWYKRAALETECFVCISYGGVSALQEVIRLLKQQGQTEEAARYEAYMVQVTEGL